MAVSGIPGGPTFYPANIAPGGADAAISPFAPPLVAATAALTATGHLMASRTVFASSAHLTATATLGAFVSGGVHGDVRAKAILAATAIASLQASAALTVTADWEANILSQVVGEFPPTTTLHGLSADFLTAVATDHRWVIKVEVRTAAGDLVADISDSVDGGSITVDETAKIRRTCTLTITGDPSLVPPQVLIDDPLSTIDMLHPAKANELWIYRGVRYLNGDEEFAQLGVFRMSKPTLVDSGSSIGFTINGNDRASVVSRLTWQKPFTLNVSDTNPTGAPGANLAAAVYTVLNYLFTNEGTSASIYPNISYDKLSSDFAFYETDIPFTYPITTWGGDPSNPSDPMSDLATFVAAAGAELFFDVVGDPVLRPIARPSLQSVVDSVHFKEGLNCTVVDLQRTIDETTAYNGVILYCNGTGTALPFVMPVWDVNQDSPTYYLGPWGQVGYRMTTTLIPAGTDSLQLAQQKAFQMADRQLQLILGSMDVVSIDTTPNPALQEGDCLLVERDRMKVSDPYVISSMTIPLDPQSSQKINFRPQVNTS